MARLPIPGKDAGTWGDVLNDYLSQVHKQDGTLKDDVVTTSAIAPDTITATEIQNGSITEAQLDGAIQAKLNTAGSGNVADGTITTAKLDDDAVTDAKITDGTITETKLATAVQTKLNQAAPTWSTLSGKPTVVAAGVDQAAARSVIGAGTSNLTLGTSSSTAKAGDYQPSWADVTSKPAVIAAGADPAGARAAIGAGTSNLTLGTTGSTAAAGNDARLSDTRVPTDNSVANAKLQDDAVTNVKIADGTIAEAKLATAVQTKLNQAAPTWNTLGDKPAVIGAGSTQAAARTAMGATTVGSNLFTAASMAAARTATNSERLHVIDVRDFGAACDGSTDDTAAWAAAIAAIDGSWEGVGTWGGVITWRGNSVVSQIELKSAVSIVGQGTEVSRITHKAGAAAGQHCMVLTDTNASNIRLQNFTILGNRTNQTEAVDGLNMSNAGGDGGSLTRHLINNVVIRECKGRGLFWGYAMRSSVIDGLTVYQCDGVGIHLSLFSDNTMQNVDVGQSGSHGFLIANCQNSKFANLKSWYSGRLTLAGSGFVFDSTCGTLMGVNLSTQESQGDGFTFLGGPHQGLVFTGMNSDSDNVAATSSNYGYRLSNLKNSVIEGTVTSMAPLGGKPYAGLNVSSNCTGNKIRINIDPAAISNWPANGNGLPGNDIDFCRGIHVNTPTAAYSPLVFQHRESHLTLTANRMINNPITQSSGPPVGLTSRYVLIQDATGGRTVTWSSDYKIPAGTTFDTTPTTRTVIDFECIADNVWVMTKFVTGIPA